MVCSNHISDSDPVALAHFLYDNGHPPYFLAKAALFKAPLVGRVIRGAGQIPVFRDGPEAVKAFAPAVEAVRQGKCVAIYPEATVSRDPDLWPMTGKTGAARVAPIHAGHAGGRGGRRHRAASRGHRHPRPRRLADVR